MFPLMAVTGDTFAAFFAGDKEAKRTIRNPIITPAINPLILNWKSGISENLSPLIDFNRRQAHHVII